MTIYLLALAWLALGLLGSWTLIHVWKVCWGDYYPGYDMYLYVVLLGPIGLILVIVCLWGLSEEYRKGRNERRERYMLPL